MLDWINKERVVFILALLLFLWGLYGFLSPEDPAGRIPRGKALDRVATVFLPPDLRIASSDEIYRKGRKDLFAEPVALKPLKPLELAPPPLANAPLTAPPPVPGPPPRYWQGLRHRTVPAAQGGAGRRGRYRSRRVRRNGRGARNGSRGHGRKTSGRARQDVRFHREKGFRGTYLRTDSKRKSLESGRDGEGRRGKPVRSQGWSSPSI